MKRFTILPVKEALTLEPELIEVLGDDITHDNLKLNIDTTDPLKGLETQIDRVRSNDRVSQAVYETPNGKRCRLSITKREAITLKQLMDNCWLSTASIKRTGETRKPISNLRCFGFWIARRETKRIDENGEKITLVKLYGDIKINPTIDVWLQYPPFEKAWLNLKQCYRIKINRLNTEIEKLTTERDSLVKKMEGLNDDN